MMDFLWTGYLALNSHLITLSLFDVSSKRQRESIHKVSTLSEPTEYFVNKLQKEYETIVSKYYLKEFGADKIIALNSCGSYKIDIKPGSIVIPDDYIDLSGGITYFDEKIVFTSPGISKVLREKINEIAKKNEINVISKGTYCQIRGPRFETIAEVKMFSQFSA